MYALVHNNRLIRWKLISFGFTASSAERERVLRQCDSEQAIGNQLHIS